MSVEIISPAAFLSVSMSSLLGSAALTAMGQDRRTGYGASRGTAAGLVSGSLPAESLIVPMSSWLSEDDVIAFEVPGQPHVHLVFGRAQSHRSNGGRSGSTVPGDLVRAATVGLDALVRAGIEVGQQQGMLVRLTKESSNAYRNGLKIKDASGAVLGVVRGESGKFSHVHRFHPAAGAPALSALTGLLSAVAMQAQLAAIQRAITEVAADVLRIERTQENLITSEMRAVDGLLRETYEAATESGELTDVMWDQIAGIALHVRKHDEFSAMQLRDITRELACQKSVKDRRSWLRKNRDRLGERLAAAQHSGVLSAQYGALRLWRLTSKNDPSRDFYVRSLRPAMGGRDALLQELIQELKRSIEKAEVVTIWSRLHRPFDSGKVKALIAQVKNDFQLATGIPLTDAVESIPLWKELEAGSTPTDLASEEPRT